MQLFTTVEGYINTGIEGRSFTLMVTRVEEFFDSILEIYCGEDDEIELPFFGIDRDKIKLFRIPLTDNLDFSEELYLDVLNFLSDLLDIDIIELEQLDYLNLRDL